MRIAIVGYGKMGKMVALAARETGHEVAAIVDPLAGAYAPVGVPVFASVAAAGNLGGANVAIEFTRPETAVANITALLARGVPTVVGTTGWHEQMDSVQLAVEASGGSLLWATNFSIGVHIFYRVAWYAAQLADLFPEYDVGGFESHHNKKLDSPSGTAKTLVDGVLSRIGRKDTAVWETLNRRPLPNELHFPSLRLGSVPGQHSLLFDSAADTIEVSHTARSREGFASGAVRAAVWLAGSAAGGRQGVFTVDDMLRDVLHDAPLL